jgi:hypothetical protein
MDVDLAVNSLAEKVYAATVAARARVANAESGRALGLSWALETPEDFRQNRGTENCQQSSLG